MSNEVESRIVDLETKLSFLQVTVDELNLIVTRQQTELTELFREFRTLLQQARGTAVDKDQDQKPPHY